MIWKNKLQLVIVLFVLCSCVNSQNNRFAINFAFPKIPTPRELLDTFIPPPPRSLFSFNPLSIFQPRTTTENSKVENGDWNFFGRDLANRVGELFKDVSDFTGFSNFTAGLDANLSNIPLVGDAVKAFQENLKLLVPGTQWCGDGNRARNFEDLGAFSPADTCCRAHDNCPDSILAGKEKYGLKNTGLFTRSLCSCDREFYKCLKNANGLIAQQIGFTYFTVLGPQCFKKEYPVESCKNNVSGKCQDYVLNNQGNKTYQWFDNKRF